VLAATVSLGGEDVYLCEVVSGCVSEHGGKNCDERLTSVKKLRINQGFYKRREKLAMPAVHAWTLGGRFAYKRSLSRTNIT
jgi:hypothetical protein